MMACVLHMSYNHKQKHGTLSLGLRFKGIDLILWTPKYCCILMIKEIRNINSLDINV